MKLEEQKWRDLIIRVLILTLSVPISRTNREGPTWKPHRGWIITAGTDGGNYYLLTMYKWSSSFVFVFFFQCPWLLTRLLETDLVTVRHHSFCPPFLFCAVHPLRGRLLFEDQEVTALVCANPLTSYKRPHGCRRRGRCWQCLAVSKWLSGWWTRMSAGRHGSSSANVQFSACVSLTTVCCEV